MMDTPIDVAEMIACVHREVKMRREVYARRVAARTMNARRAAREIDVMIAVHKVLLDLMEDRAALPQLLRDRDEGTDLLESLRA